VPGRAVAQADGKARGSLFNTDAQILSGTMIRTLCSSPGNMLQEVLTQPNGAAHCPYNPRRAAVASGIAGSREAGGAMRPAFHFRGARGVRATSATGTSWSGGSVRRAASSARRRNISRIASRLSRCCRATSGDRIAENGEFES
jgi:hypothetical protein